MAFAKLDGTEGEATDGGVLLQHWQALAQIMGGFDVILMQEIPGEEKTREERIHLFLEMLAHGTEQGLKWSYVHSLPSGVGGLSSTSNKEVRAEAVVRHRIKRKTAEADLVNANSSFREMQKRIELKSEGSIAIEWQTQAI